MNYVVYHANCTDGFGAAFSAWLHFKDNATYIPLNHYDPIPAFFPNSKIYILDFCFPKEELIKLSQYCEILVLDHHISAKKDVQELIDNPIKNLTLIFKENVSGSILAWEHWHNNSAPDFFKNIQDRDLGKFQFSETKGVIAALMTYEKTFSTWEKLSQLQLKSEGETILRIQDQLMKEMLEKWHWAEIGGHWVPVVNATSYWSDITSKLLELVPNVPFAAAYYALDAERIKWSLRSTKESQVDVSLISTPYGGGGHKNSAGFTAKKDQIKFTKNPLIIKKAS